jgi:S-formylglutathione hydrolase
MHRPLEFVASHACFGGVQRYYRHASRETGLQMPFGIYLPPRALHRAPVPALLCLGDVDASEDTFASLAGAQRLASEMGLALITPDTRPRAVHLPEAANSFYLDATQAPWSRHWRMESYLVRELLPLVAAELPIDGLRLGILGHGMGGHGALMLALRHPGLFRSLSAFAPIASAASSSCGQLALGNCLGPGREAWQAYDACALMAAQARPPYPRGILVDQGLADTWLAAQQLQPEALVAACAQVGQPLTLRRHARHDHGYHFIQSFIDDHLHHHAAALG